MSYFSLKGSKKSLNSLNQKSLEKFCDQSFEVSAGLDSMTRKVARREWARFTNI